MKMHASLRRWGFVCAAIALQGCASSVTPSPGQSTGAGSGTSAASGSTGSTPTSGTASGNPATSAGSTAAAGSTAVGSGSSSSSGAATSSGSSSSASDVDATATASGASSGASSPTNDAGGYPDGTVFTDGGATNPSNGCGTIPTQATGKYVQYNIMVTGLPDKYASMYTARNYYVMLPQGYDPTRAYTTVFLGTGCGGNGTTVLPMQNASKGNAILVGLSPVGQCFMTSAADSPEIPFFDQALAQVESSFCVDKAHVFIAGFSSGSWLSNLIGCARAGIVRGQGNATGGLPPVPTCTGPIAAMLAHDEGDPANNISGGEMARDRILMQNGCSLTETMPYDPGTGKASMCVQYKNCPAAYPVVWCPTTGQGHSDQVATGLSVPGFWNFWEALPYVAPTQ